MLKKVDATSLDDDTAGVLAVLHVVLLAGGARSLLLGHLVLDTVLASVVADLVGVELGQSLGGLDVADLLIVALGKDDINLLKGSTGLRKVELATKISRILE